MLMGHLGEEVQRSLAFTNMNAYGRRGLCDLALMDGLPGRPEIHPFGQSAANVRVNR